MTIFLKDFKIGKKRLKKKSLEKWVVKTKYLYIKSDYVFEDTPVEAYIEVDKGN